MARHFELHSLSHSIAFSMNSNFSLVVQIGLAVPFCLQFWYSFDKLQRGEILQALFSKSRKLHKLYNWVFIYGRKLHFLGK